MRRLKSYFRRYAREARIHASRLRQPADLPRVIIFTEKFRAGQSPDLRGAAIGRQLRHLGWRVTAVTGELDLEQRQRLLGLEKPAVILLQQTRHPLNHPRFYPGIPCVLDIDDADITDPLISDGIIERARQSRAIIVGNRWLADVFRQYHDDVSVVWTGSYLVPNSDATPPRDRAPIVCWAHSNAFGYREEAKLVQTVALKLAAQISFEFWLYGVNDPWMGDAFLEPLQRAGVKTKAFGAMKYLDFVKSLEEVAVGLHPICMEAPFSRGKSFGKLHAYIAAQVAIVTSDELDHPLFFRDGESASLIEGNDINAWVSSTDDLIRHPDKRQRYADAALRDHRLHLTVRRAAEHVDRVLRRAANC
jgi:hypothetical protein